jgi:hypothetical protein
MTAESASPGNGRSAPPAGQFTTQLKEAPGRLKDSLIAEFAVAVAWAMTYVKGNRTWDGLARLAVQYHWPQASAFQNLIAPGLAAHAWGIAVACPFVLTFLAFTWNWPVGSYVLFFCAGAYSYLTLNWFFYVVAGIAGLAGFWIFGGRRNPPVFANFVFAAVVTFVVTTVALYL